MIVCRRAAEGSRVDGSYRFPITVKADTPSIDLSWELTATVDFADVTGVVQWNTLQNARFVGDVPNSWLSRLPWTSFPNNANPRTIDVSFRRITEDVAGTVSAEWYVFCSEAVKLTR